MFRKSLTKGFLATTVLLGTLWGGVAPTAFGEGPLDPAPYIEARGNVNDKKVLFDNTHGQTAGAADWVIDGGFSDFAEGLADNGYYVKELRQETPITYSDLQDYDVFVIPEANIPFKTSEQDAMLEYVSSGGSIFFISDHYNADRNKNRIDSSEIMNGYRRGGWEDPTFQMNDEEKEAMQGVESSDWLGENFGIRFRYNGLGNAKPTNIVAPSESFGITEGVELITMYAGSTLAILDNTKAKGIAYVPTGVESWKYAEDGGVYNNGGIEEGPYAAISKMGEGKAAFIGDSSPVEDNTPKYLREESGTSKTTYPGFTDEDNGTLLVNIVDWLATPESYTSFTETDSFSLSPVTALYDFEIPQNSTQEPYNEPWQEPAPGYKWYDRTTFKPGSYGYVEGDGGGDDGGGDGSPTDKIFISEYIEGGSLNKAIEIYNNTNAAIDLSSYKLELSNPETVALSGTIEAGETFVIAHSEANSDILSVADMTAANLNFNGDDAVTLYNGSEIVDVVGIQGTTFAKDTTLVRMSNVTTGQTAYDASEWDVYGKDVSTDLGMHTIDMVASDQIFISEYIEGSSNNKAIELYNASDATIDLSSYTLELSNPRSIALSGTIEAGEVFVVAHSQANSTILAEADMTHPNLEFNGDDTVILMDTASETVVDMLGFGPKQEYAKNTTLVRMGDVTTGSTTYDATQWDVYAVDTTTNLGSHDIGGGSSNGGLFVSEYIEGSGNSKAIELYNGTNVAIDLSNYTLELSNPRSITLQGTIAAGEVFVIAHSQADSTILAEADMTHPNLEFNGDDTVTLMDTASETVVDMLGFGPAQEYAKDTTLVRKPCVTAGTTSYLAAEWEVYAQNTFNYLGSH
ncbi:lamin tail domain-containing protein [Longirhabdus pacifica]|uniref:lamin tail domain-containing protein n=1 Tax=Longirhabdus pacifica TaxID=2305227 RepID=UPI001008C9A9|nr:lamin tail domain-containing protein [Longirhabdus pacifica]